LCRYEFFKGTDFVQKTKTNSYTFGVGELPEGTTTVSVRAIDSEGADLRASVDVFVAPKPADYNVEDEIFGMDVQQAVGSNDPSMLAKTGTLLTTLTDMSTTEAISTRDQARRRLLVDGSTGTPADSGIAEAVKIKVMQLLSALSSSATSSIMDAATVRQVSASWCLGSTERVVDYIERQNRCCACTSTVSYVQYT
jgi:hypothetical protein